MHLRVATETDPALVSTLQERPEYRAMIAADERAGFFQEGLLLKHGLRRTGDLADLRLYGVLRTEWTRTGEAQ